MYDIDRDYDLWLQQQADFLRNGKFEALDVDHLIEELEALVRGEKSAVESLTINIMVHLLYCQYWTSQTINQNHWRGEIVNFRAQLESKLTTNLKKHLQHRLDYLYGKAKKIVELKSGMTIPETSYSLEEVLDDNFLP
ncbi:protein of unknown function DUF29 [Halothece sp. PCC 7418]|uniref:DUF29 domain-containing protein n=1 Tax=Halothece sp. (strain PCC 7418) TaxID=65093 RepID=UPI0002A07FE4|nr:DUF29 domain-containing protein [Halothece sp. PCC 7418]AFZ45480.1 protein of unknown function DUF29 [Halothece sp. PCC 7418]